jgi:hypothetical protein
MTPIKLQTRVSGEAGTRGRMDSTDVIDRKTSQQKNEMDWIGHRRCRRSIPAPWRQPVMQTAAAIQ